MMSLGHARRSGRVHLMAPQSRYGVSSIYPKRIARRKTFFLSFLIAWDYTKRRKSLLRNLHLRSGSQTISGFWLGKAGRQSCSNPVPFHHASSNGDSRGSLDREHNIETPSFSWDPDSNDGSITGQPTGRTGTIFQFFRSLYADDGAFMFSSRDAYGTHTLVKQLAVQHTKTQQMTAENKL